MGRIIVLDEFSANQIAAGEVVERPASVAKELAENSIDAGASHVDVEIRNGGISEIRVTDDGEGFYYDDAPLAFERHATSKIREAGDIDAVATLGFRGEALPSIAAVSKLRLSTRRREAEFGRTIEIHGGRLARDERAGMPAGTTVTVSELFYNMPARYKFLRKDSAEAAAISDIITRLAIGRPEASFRLRSQSGELLRTPGGGNLADAVHAALGAESFAGLYALEYREGAYSVDGFWGRPEDARGNRNGQFFYVNGRHVRNRALYQAVEESYRTHAMRGRHPVAILRVTMDPALLDVNAHPAKTEVRFASDSELFRVVCHALGAAFGGRMAGFARGGFVGGGLRGGVSPGGASSGAAHQSGTGPSGVLSDGAGSGVAHQSGAGSGDVLPGGTGSSAAHQSGAGSGAAHQSGTGSSGVLPGGTGSGAAHQSGAGSGAVSRGSCPSVDHSLTGVACAVAAGAPDLSAKDATAQPVDPASPEVPSEHEPRDCSNACSLREGPQGFAQYRFTASATNIGAKGATGEAGATGATGEVAGGQGGSDGIGSGSDGIGLSASTAASGQAAEELTVVGQAFGAYIIAERGDALCFIDQHAAHERALYEELRARVEQGAPPPCQMLVEPVAIELLAGEAQDARDLAALMSAAGFSYDEFGRGAILLRGVPAYSTRKDSKAFFLESLESARLETAKASKGAGRLLARDEALYSIACKAAVKANRRLSFDEAAELARRTFELPEPRTCPHGRPLTVEISKRELDRRFKRTL